MNDARLVCVLHACCLQVVEAVLRIRLFKVAVGKALCTWFGAVLVSMFWYQIIYLAMTCGDQHNCMIEPWPKHLLGTA